VRIFFAAVAGADLAFAVAGDFLLLAFLFHLEQAGAQEAHGLGFVLVLRALVLALDDHVRGQVGDADGG